MPAEDQTSATLYFLRLLGSPLLEGPEGSRTGQTATGLRMALLALLGTSASGRMSRDKIVGLLWPDQSEKAARHSLADIVYRLRKSLGDDAVASAGEAVSLSRTIVRVDAHEFALAINEDDLSAAVGLYGGPFLDGFHLRGASHQFESWVDYERSRLALEYEKALETLAGRAEDAGDLVCAAESWRRFTQHDPANSRVVVRLMRALAGSGDAANAVQLAAEHERYLSDELGLDLPTEVTDLRDALRTEPAETVAAFGFPEPVATRNARADARHRASRPASAPSDLSRSADETGRAPGRRLAGLRSPIGVLLASLAALLVAYAAVNLLGFRGSGADMPQITWIAVLPLNNTSADPNDEFFVDGLTEALISELGRISSLNVISRQTAMHYKGAAKPLPEIARELDVDALLEGSMLRIGDDVRITLQLVHGSSDRQLWTDEYVDAFHDVIPLQRRVSRSVAEGIQLRLSPSEVQRLEKVAYTPDPRAYAAYLKGRHHFNRWGIRDAQPAREHYEEAIALDSAFADAHAALAELCVMLPPLNAASLSWTIDDCLAIAERALELDPENSDAHAALGLARNGQWDWLGAEESFRRAIALNPNSVTAHVWYSVFLSQMMRLDKAVTAARRAEQLDPLNLLTKALLVGALMNGHQYEEGLAKIDETVRLDPDYGAAYVYQGTIHNLLGEPQAALVSARKAENRIDEDSGQVLTLKAWAHALIGDEQTALGFLARMQEVHGQASFPVFQATVYLALGREEEALDILEEGFRERLPWLPHSTSYPHLDAIRDHPRFQALRQGMGLH